MKKSKKGITIPQKARLSLNISVYHGATLTIVRVRVVHKILRKNSLRLLEEGNIVHQYSISEDKSQ